MHISDLLRSKGSEVVTIRSDRTVLEAVQTLVDHNIGAAVVGTADEVEGILSERDVLRLTARGPDRVVVTLVSEVMSTDLVTATEDDTLAMAMDAMTTNRVRHLPILDGSTLVGIVSIGDVVNALRTGTEEENRHLKQYIAGAG